MLVQTWGDVLIASFQELWGGVVSFVPKLVVAFVVFLVGWVIAVTLGKVVSQVVRSLKLDSLLRGAVAGFSLLSCCLGQWMCWGFRK